MDIITDFLQQHPLDAPQIVGLMAFGFDVLALLSMDDRKFKWLFALATLMLAIHFAMLDKSAPAVSLFISATRFWVAIYPWARKLTIPYIAIYLIAGYANYTTPIDLLPITSGITATFAVFYLAGVRMRALMMVCSVLWLTHNFIRFTYGGILVEGTFMLLNAYTITRLVLRYRRTKINHVKLLAAHK